MDEWMGASHPAFCPRSENSMYRFGASVIATIGINADDHAIHLLELVIASGGSRLGDPSL